MQWMRYAKLALLVSIVLGTVGTLFAQADSIRVADGLIKVQNSGYEIDFSASNGAITAIRDTATKAVVSSGNSGGGLWSATLDNDKLVDAASEDFSYSIDGQTLTLTYGGDVDVTVTVDVSEGNSLRLQAVIANQTGRNLRLVGFPNDLKITEADVKDALLPLMPGALLNADFFQKGGTYNGQYPGELFADYEAVQTTTGKIALYAQIGTVVQPVYAGFEHVSAEAGQSALTHNYKTWIADGTTWTSPWTVIRVGQDYPDTIVAYRVENRIDQYPSLREKLGDDARKYFSEAMYKLDVQVLHQPFSDLISNVATKMNFPGIVEPVAFQVNGHDRNYPDMLPPATRWGTTEDFAALVQAIHDQGGLVVPYTNLSWWDVKGPTLLNLPDGVTLNDIMVEDAHGLPDFETYSAHSGVVVDLNNAFVEARIAQEHAALINDVGVDGIFEDQWGNRAAPYDFNAAAANPATGYFEGVLKHFDVQKDSRILTEVGVDVLAKDAVGFMGTNYLWDMLGYRGATAPFTTYYPMAGMLLRDKVLLYQHNLAAETWTNNKDMLRWNLAMGYNLSNAFLDSTTSGLNMDNPWLNLVGVFQKYVLANYADEPIEHYEEFGSGLIETNFETYQVISNIDASSAQGLDMIKNVKLAPGGVAALADDGSVTAGIFTSYNGADLTPGDHYLVEVRSEDGIKVFQPVGDDTPIQIMVTNADKSVVQAYGYDGHLIGTVEATATLDGVGFEYKAMIDGQAVGYYNIR